MIFCFDLDDTLYSTSELMDIVAERYALENGIPYIFNPRGYYASERYGFSDGTVFWDTHTEEVVQQVKLYSGADYFVNKCKELGHSAIIMTHRESRLLDVTKYVLHRDGIQFDMILCSRDIDKVDECIKLGVDYLFEDKASTVQKAVDNRLKVFAKKHQNNWQIHGSGVVTFDDWNEVDKVIFGNGI